MYFWKSTKLCFTSHWSDFSHKAISSCKGGWKCSMLAVCHVNINKIEILLLRKRDQTGGYQQILPHNIHLLSASLCLILYLILALSDSLDALTIWLLKKKIWEERGHRSLEVSKLYRLKYIYEGS